MDSPKTFIIIIIIIIVVVVVIIIIIIIIIIIAIIIIAIIIIISGSILTNSFPFCLLKEKHQLFVVSIKVEAILTLKINKTASLWTNRRQNLTYK